MLAGLRKIVSITTATKTVYASMMSMDSSADMLEFLRVGTTVRGFHACWIQKNVHDFVWSDSSYSGECFANLLSLGAFESLIHENGADVTPISDPVPMRAGGVIKPPSIAGGPSAVCLYCNPSCAVLPITLLPVTIQKSQYMASGRLRLQKFMPESAVE
jgi:hypothetical protein